MHIFLRSAHAYFHAVPNSYLRHPILMTLSILLPRPIPSNQAAVILPWHSTVPSSEFTGLELDFHSLGPFSEMFRALKNLVRTGKMDHAELVPEA